MNLRTLLTANAVVQFVFGIGFLATPVFFLETFGAQTDPTGFMLTRVAGGLIISLGIISWLGKAVSERAAQNAIVWGMIVAHLGAGVLTLLSVLDGTFNVLGWSAVVIDAFFVAAFLWVPKK